MNQALAKKENTAVVQLTPASLPTETILKSDVVIPKVLLMQGLSEFVTEGHAKMGDIIRSTSVEKLGDPTKPLEIVPLTFKNTWIISELVGKKYEFRGVEDRNAKNESDPWDYEKNGTAWKRTKSIELFALLPADVSAEAGEIEKFKKTGEMPDLTKTLLPVVISFRSKSYNAGKRVVTHFTQAAGMAKFGVKPYGFTLKLSCAKESNDKGTYYVWEVKQGGRVAPEVLERAGEWYQLVATQSLKVDEASESKADGKSAPEQF